MRALVLLLLVAACFADRRSDDLICHQQSDCTGNRICRGGYCIVDVALCPKQCTSCDVESEPHTCFIDISGDPDDNLTCPTGMACEITCHDEDSCADITCPANTFCHIRCLANRSCETITCSSACACDVECASGNCQNLSCPQVSGSGGYCTVNGNNNQPCTSAISGCTRC